MLIMNQVQVDINCFPNKRFVVYDNQGTNFQREIEQEIDNFHGASCGNGKDSSFSIGQLLQSALYGFQWESSINLFTRIAIIMTVSELDRNSVVTRRE